MNSPVNRYRYVISNRLAVLQVAALGESNFTIEWQREDDGKLDYKNQLPSKIVFRDAAYANLHKLEKSIYRCEFVQITIERHCVIGGIESWVAWFSGRMSLNDGDWNEDRCEVEIKLDDVKNEQCFDDNKSQELNILSGIFSRRSVFLNPTNVTIEKVSYSDAGDAGAYPCDSLIIWGGAGTPEAGGWAFYAYHYELVKDFEPHTCTVSTSWAREVMIVDCADPAPGSEWVLVEDTCPGGNKKYARPARTYGCAYLYPDYNSSVEVTDYQCKIVGDATTNIAIDNGVSLEDILNLFINTFCPGLSVVSNFFQINPDIATSINYVTGQRSKTRFITWFQKSDMKRPTASGNASIANISFEKVIAALVNMFNVRWRIEGTDFRIEHVSYFNKTLGFDLTQPQYSKFIVGCRRYSYENNEIPAREEFHFMESGQGDFKGLPIVYSGGCVSQSSRGNVKTINVERVTTDVELILSNPDPDSTVVDDDGFAVVACDFDGTDYFIISEGTILGGSTLNNSMAWAQLQRDYYKYDRPLSRGNMNGVDTTFYSVKPTKKGIPISIPLCCSDSFDPDDLVLTPLGQGVVDKGTFSFKDGMLKLDLLYPADAGLVSNLAPVAINDVVTTYIDTAIHIIAIANDTDADSGDSVTRIEILVPPLHGTAVIQLDKSILYTPAAGYEGDDNIVYRIYDQWNQPSNNALISITVRPTNTAPVAVNDSYIATLDTLLSIVAPGVFTNDSDDASFSLDSFDAVSVHGGTVVVNADGSFTYDPAPGYYGPDSFTYTIIDGLGLTDTATVNLDVRNPNNPVANDDAYVTRKNTNLTIAAAGVLINDTTTIGTLTTIPGTTPTAAGGSVTMNSDGSFTYVPPTNYVGVDSFLYTASNGSGTDQATVTINVLPDIFVRLQMVSTESEFLTRYCPFAEDAGISEKGIFKLFFYSNSGGTTPLDVSGMGLTVNLLIHGLYFGGGTYDLPIFENPSGTEFTIFGGSPYEYHHDEIDCSGARPLYVNESISVQPGLYTII